MDLERLQVRRIWRGMLPKSSWYKVLSPNEANTEQLQPQLGRGSLQMKCSLLFVQTENWEMSVCFLMKIHCLPAFLKAIGNAWPQPASMGVLKWQREVVK